MQLGITPEQRALKIWNANVCSQFSVTSQVVDTALAEALGDTLEEKRANALLMIDKARYKPVDLFYLGHDGEVPAQSGIIETNAFGIAIFEGNEKVVRLHAQDNEMKLLDNLKPFKVYETKLITDKLNMMTQIPTVEIGKSSTFTEAAEDSEKYKALHERCKPINLDTVSDFIISVDTTDFRIVIGKVVGCHWKYGGRLYIDCKYNSSGTFRVILNGKKEDVRSMVGKTVKLLGAIYKDKNAHVFMKCYAIMSINEV